jgi:hypothetical protein
MTSDRLILEPEIVRGLTPDEAVNYVRHAIGKAREAVRKAPPPPTDEVTAIDHLVWERRVMSLHGQALGALMFATAFGVIPVALGEVLRQELKSAILHRMMEAMMGVVPT